MATSPSAAALQITVLLNNKPATAAIGKINAALKMLGSIALTASVSMQALTASATAAVAPLEAAGAAAAALSKALSQRYRGIGTSLNNIARGANAAAPAMQAAAGAALSLAIALQAVQTASAGYSQSIGAVTGAAKAAASHASSATKSAQAAQMAGASATKQAVASEKVAATATLAANATNAQAAASAKSAAASSAAAAGAAQQAAGNEMVSRSSRKAAADQATLWSRMSDAGSELRKVGSQMQWTGRQLAFMFTATALLAGGFGMKWALDVERAMTHLRKVYSGAGEDVDKLAKYFRALSDVMGENQEEVAGIGAMWAQVGSQGAELARLTRLTTEAMILGNMEAAEATNALIAVQAQYKLSAEELKETLSILNMVENTTGANMADLILAYSRSASVARQAGVDQAHLAAMIAALVPATGSAANAGNGLKSILSRLMAPTKEAAAEFLKMGINVEDAGWRAMSVTERLHTLADAYAELSQQQKIELIKPLAGLFQISRAAQLLEDVANRNGDALSYYGQALRGATDETIRMQRYQDELNTVLKSNPRLLKQAGVVIKNNLIDAIVPLIPHVVWLARGIAKMTSAFSELSPATQKWIILSIALLAILGPIIMFIGSLVLLAGVAAKSFGFLGRAISGIAFHFFGLGKRMKEVDGAMRATTPFIVRAWTFLHATMETVAAATMLVLRTIYAVGMAAIALLVKAGGALGLKHFAFYQALQTKTQAAASMARARIVAREQAATYGMVVAGGRAQTAAAAAGSAGILAVTAARFRNLLMIVAGTFLLFPTLATSAMSQMWNGIKNGANRIGTALANLGKKVMSGFAPGTAARDFGERFIASLRESIARITPVITDVLRRLGFTLEGGLTKTLGRIITQVVPKIVGLFSGPIGWLITGVLILLDLFGDKIQEKLSNIFGFKFNLSSLLNPFALVINIVTGMLKKFGFDVAGFWTSLWNSLSESVRSGISALGRGLLAPFITMLRNLREAAVRIFSSDSGVPLLARPFVFAVEAIKSAMAVLPKVVIAAFRAVLRVIEAVARAIYRAFQYINPFARHSPSLVDNVRDGTAQIAQDFAQMAASVEGSTQRAYSSIKRFSDATAGIRLQNQQRERADERGKIVAASGPAAGVAYDVLRADLDAMNSSLRRVNDSIATQERRIDALNAQIKAADRNIKAMNKTLTDLRKNADAIGKSLSDAQDKLNEYVNAPIQGMGAMADAIFENEMAQKRLRLEIMKLEDAGESVDVVRDKFALLQGEIETLHGQRNELRAAGAGSDILGVYDEMIDNLRAQQGALATEGVSEIEKATKELEELQRRGEMLQLEQSLKFDPLNRQIEKMTNNLQELPFEQKVAGIKRYQAEVDRLTVAHDAANKAVEAQEAAIEAATEARDALAERLEAEQDHLSELQKLQSELNKQIQEGETAIRESVSAMDSMAAAAEAAAREQEKLNDSIKGTSDAVDKLKDSLGKGGKLDDLAGGDLGLPEGMEDFELPGGSFDPSDFEGDIDELTKGLLEEFAKAFEGVDLFEPIKRKWRNFKDWVKGIPGEIGGLISRGFSNAWEWFTGLYDGLNRFMSESGDRFREWASGLPGRVKEWLQGVGQAFKEKFSGIWPDNIKPQLDEIPGNLSNFLKELPTHLVQAVSYMVGYIAGTIAKPLIDAFKIGNRVREYFTTGEFSKDVGELASTLGAWANESIIQPIGRFVTEWIPSAFYAIRDYFLAGGFATDAYEVRVKIQDWVYDSIIQPIKNFLVERVGGSISWLWEYFTTGQFATDAYEVRVKIENWVKDNIIEPAKNWIKENVAPAVAWLWEYFTTGQFAVDAYEARNKLFEYGKNLIQGLWDGIWSLAKDAGAWIKENLVDRLTKGFRDGAEIESPSRVFYRYGLDIVKGLWNGIKDAGVQLAKDIKDWAWETVKKPFKDEMEVKSPSRWMAEQGEYIAEGLALGMENGTDRVVAASEILASAASLAGGVSIAAPAVEGLTNPASGIDTSMQETFALANKKTQEFIAQQALLLAQLKTTYNTEFTAISTTTVTTLQNMQNQVMANANAWKASLGQLIDTLNTNITNSLQTMHNQTSSNATSWRQNLESICKLMHDNLIATITAMVNSLIAEFTRQRDQMTSLANTTRDNVSNAFKQLADNLYNTVNGSIKPILESFKPMLENVVTWFASTVQNIGTQWAGVKEPVAVPARFIVNDVYDSGIRQAWNKVASWIDQDELPSFRASFASGTSSITKGYTPGRDVHRFISSDGSMAINLSGGEAIMRPEVTKALGPHKIDSLNAAAKVGGVKAVRGALNEWGFSSGGIFDLGSFQAGGRVQGAITTPVQRRMWELVAPRFPSIILTSGTRNEPGSQHHTGNALDLSDGTWNTPGMYALANWISDNYPPPLTYQLIHGNYNRNIGNGSWAGDGMGFYGAGTMGQHHNHVHWAVKVVLPEPGTEPDPALMAELAAMGGGAAYISIADIVAQTWDSVMKPIREKAPEAGGLIGTLPLGGYDKMNDTARAWVIAKAQEMQEKSAYTGYAGGGGVERWRPLVLDLLAHYGHPASLAGSVLRRMNQESGGDPNIVNTWDSNWQRGTPSVGLMQVIGPTYASNKDPFFDKGPYLYGVSVDPAANISASFRYAMRRYGSLSAAYDRPGGYDSGGWLQPGITAAVNQTGRPEAVLTSAQWSNISKLATSMGSLLRNITRSLSITLGKIFKKPIPTKPVDPPVIIPDPPVPPEPPLPPKNFWSDAAAQMASWGPDIEKVIGDGLVANAARMPDMITVPEWPDIPPPPPPPPVQLPEIQLPPELFPDWPAPGTPGGGTPGGGTPGGGTPGGGTGGTPGTGTGGGSLQSQLDNLAKALHNGMNAVVKDMTPVLNKSAQELGPVLQQAAGMLFRDPVGAFNLAANALQKQSQAVLPELVKSVQAADKQYGLTPEQQKQLLSSAIAEGQAFAARHGVALSAETLRAMDELKRLQEAAIKGDPYTIAVQANGQASATISSSTAQSSVTITVNINGDISMPNIKTKDDAAAFLANLRNLVKV